MYENAHRCALCSASLYRTVPFQLFSTRARQPPTHVYLKAKLGKFLLIPGAKGSTNLISFAQNEYTGPEILKIKTYS